MSAISQPLRNSPVPWAMKPFMTAIRRITTGTLNLTTPEGVTVQIGNGGEPRASVTINEWRALRKIFAKGDIALAECLREGQIICNDLTELVKLALRNQAHLGDAIYGNPLLQLGHRLKHLLNANTRAGSRRNIHAHYDLGNEFYKIWLDPSMTYSSACFDGDLQGDLLQAQQRKYQNMLELSGAAEGGSILEIGCGWGGFAEHAAQQGCRVEGITLSPEQLNYAQQRMEGANLSDQVRLRLLDYRDVVGSFNHIVSIEMLEAVGEAYWDTYFAKVNHLLSPGGQAAIQVITIDEAHFERYRKGTDFIQQYIFPGGMLPTKSALQALSDKHGFKLKAMNAYGKDYAETLRRWRYKFEANLPEVSAQGFDQQFIRTWRLYLSYCEAAFDENRIDLVQMQIEKA